MDEYDSDTIEEHLQAGRRLASPPDGDDVVISGLAGRFPNSDNVYEFQENLFAKKDLVTDVDRHWEVDHPEIPRRAGKINHVSKFDASFFGIHPRQAEIMDPISRMLMERTYECLVDAGLNPQSLRGSRTGVFVGTSMSETEKAAFYDLQPPNGYALTGTSKALQANRLSYVFGFNGPSFTLDTACSSSLCAFDVAYKSIRDGHCDSAVVAGTNLCLQPIVSLQFYRLGVLSLDGKCKVFDEQANGYARSEAIVAMFLQKSKDAKRIYAKVVHSKSNCDGYKPEGITYPASKMQQRLLTEVCKESRVHPHQVTYIEAHGTGTMVGDPEEVKAIDNVFCPGRSAPLLVGSVKSNMGHAEPSSGLCSITKVIIALETGFIPPNINLNRLRQDIEALKTGRIQVVTEKTPWTPHYAGVNAFGFGGVNCHVLLLPNPKQKTKASSKDELPRLVMASGRTEEAVDVILDDLERRVPVDPEFVSLLHNVFDLPITGHLYRGYVILNENGYHARHVQHFSGEQRPVWFVFSGMGTQWPAMGRELMAIPVFAEAVERCQRILEPRGVDIRRILVDPNADAVDNILNAFVGITAVQIGLVDVLNALGVVPDGIVGHSLGEVACGYADGCFNTEQALLASYWRGFLSLEGDYIKGAMAAVGLNYKDLQDILPPEIDIACRNSADNSTISGPYQLVQNIVNQLSERGVFAKMVNSANMAYHSRYIQSGGQFLLARMRELVPTPKERSARWVSSSVPEDDWNTPIGRFSSAEYHTNNILKPVLFADAIAKIPDNAIVVEVGPHGLLQAILKRALNNSVVHVPLTRRLHRDNSEHLLEAIGRMYEYGVQPHVHKLYPEVQFPVSRGTPMISPLIRWEHSQDWFVMGYSEAKKKTGERHVTIDVSDEDYQYLRGHVIDGRNLFPATGYLYLVWETLASIDDKRCDELSVVFEDVRFTRATNIGKDGTVNFKVMVQKASGQFEVEEGGVAVVTGRISAVSGTVPDMFDMSRMSGRAGQENGLTALKTRDVYKELRLRGYTYSGLFRSLVSVDNLGNSGKVKWAKNWVAFLDNLLQIQIVSEDTRSLKVPTAIDRLAIDVLEHSLAVENLAREGHDTSLPIFVYKDASVIRAPGVEIRSLKATSINRRRPAADPVLEEYLFVPHLVPATPPLSLRTTLRMCVQLLLENTPAIEVRAVEVVDTPVIQQNPVLMAEILAALGDLPLIQPHVTVLTSPGAHTEDLPSNITVENKKLTGEKSHHLVIASNVLCDEKKLQTLISCLQDGGCLLAREPPTSVRAEEVSGLVLVVDQIVEEGGRVLLLRKTKKPENTAIVRITEKNFLWLPDLQAAMASKDNARVVLVAQGEPLNGVLGLVNCVRKEPGGDKARCVLVLDPKAPPFDQRHPFYKTQLDRDLAVNVYKNGRWGSYRHFCLGDVPTTYVPHAVASVTTRGDLSSFKWQEGPLDPATCPPDVKQNLVHVYYSALNFRDVMMATGKLQHDESRLQSCAQGLEFSGRDVSGKRVMGMRMYGALASIVTSDPELTWEVPEHWTLEESATIPVVYGTAYWALATVGRMRRGESVLIHAGSGGVGQAAINIALHEGLTVYTTVGTQEKRDFIKRHFPQITDKHIFNSRDTSFEQGIMEVTKGRGVDLVLNSLAEEKLQASTRCLACGGRFLEIGKFDMSNNNALGMGLFLRNCSFQAIMLDTLFDGCSENKKLLHDIVMKGIQDGAVQPLSRTVFKSEEVEQAFRYMAAGKHIGKVLLHLRQEEPERMNVPEIRLVKAHPRVFCNPQCSYVIVGGLGGFGLELADWLVLRGARNLVLTSRHGVVTGYQSYRLRIWRSYGTRVVVATDDVTSEKGVESIVTKANALGDVEGIFNVAVVLADALLENQTPAKFATSAAPKAVATRLLDAASRRLCPHLHHFVVFSSAACGLGNAGQTNYGFSNSAMERICESRRAEGLPGLAIQWGAVGDVGLLAEMQEDQLEMEVGGTLLQSISSCLSVIDGFVRQKSPVVSSMVVAEKRVVGSTAGTAVDSVANIMGIRDMKTVSTYLTLAELGLDSMMTVEIKQTLEREFEVFLTTQDIRSLTFDRLRSIQETSESVGTVATSTLEQGDASPVGGLELLLRGDVPDNPETVVTLPSKASGPTVVMLPGVEGRAASLEHVARTVQARVLCLQLPVRQDYVDVPEMSKELLARLVPELSPAEPFSLVGYSFGGLLAVELAHALESQSRRGRIVLLDGAPELLTSICAHESDELLQTTILRVAVADTPSLDRLNTWSERLDHALATLPSMYQKREPITALYQRLKAAGQYRWSHDRRLESPVLLIRPSHPAEVMVSEDCGLSKLCKNVKIVTVDGDHSTVLDNPQLARHIEAFFGEQKEYRERSREKEE